jgi:radical SAM protein with 4Fe4S-binding SPASM domain
MNDKAFVLRKQSHMAGLFKEKQPLLKHLDVELTERCNNACIHCYINLPENDQEAKKRELNTDKWKDILQQAADLGALSVRFTGGEPLLREDFPELYLFARHLGMKVYLYTNARLITPELADLFSHVPPLEKIEISLYGMNPTSSQAITRSSDAYRQSRRGMDLLMQKQIPFTTKSIIIQQTINEIEIYENWLKTLPFDIKPAYSVLFDLRTRRDSPVQNCLIKDLRNSPDEILAIHAHHDDNFVQDMAQFGEHFLYPHGDELFNCGAGHQGCVDAYGQYQMCMLLRHPDLVHDLSKGGLREGLLENFPNWCQLRATNTDYLTRCAKCFLKGLCEQCPAKSWMEHGTLDTPVEYLCQVAHAKARYLGLLEEGESAWEISDWQERIHTFVQQTKSEPIQDKSILQVESENEQAN